MGRLKKVIGVGTSYQALAQSYHDYLLDLGYDVNSCRSRYHRLLEFLAWLEQEGVLDIRKVSPEQIECYYTYLSHRPSKKDGHLLTAKTTYSHLHNVGCFFSMLLSEGMIAVHPSSSLQFSYPVSRVERVILSQSEVQELYEVCETAQERAILSMAYGCGLRVGELVSCNILDVRLPARLLIVPNGKGKKRRVVPLSSGVAKDLGDYYYGERLVLSKGRSYSGSESAFMLHARGGRMQKWTYNSYLKSLIARTGNESIKQKQISIHSLRHSIATHLIEQGVSVEQVRQFLGHSQLETTQVYTHISGDQLKELI